MISHARLVRMTDAAVELCAASTFDEIAQIALGAFDDLLSCDWSAVRLSSTVLPMADHVRSTRGSDVAYLGDHGRELAHEDPVYNARLRLLIDRPAQPGEFVDRSAFESTRLFNEIWRPMSTRRVLSARSPGRFGYSMVAGRFSGDDFTEDDGVLMHSLTRHVEAATARLVTAGRGAIIVGGKPVALQRMSWLVFDEHGTILRAMPAALVCLRACLGAAASTTRVCGEWMAEMRRRHRGAPASALKYRAGERTITCHVAPIRACPGEYSAYFVEHTAQPNPLEPLLAAGLTPREAEVLRWVTEGKTNGEVGVILGISELTAKKHMENIFHKLGVTTRTAAVSRALELGMNHR